MPDTHRLNVFLVAAETLNFTEAGRQLHMTQPSVSQHIQALENHFELARFHRIYPQVKVSLPGALSAGAV